MRRAFADRLADALADCGTPLCMGIDPHPQFMPGFLARQPVAAALRDFGLIAIEAARSARLPAIKPQMALFEQHGPDGLAALADIAAAGQDAGLLVIMDAKRGDIGSTSAAYAAAYFGKTAPFRSDALTVNPYMGMDTLQPFIDSAIADQGGLFILVRTSNDGAGDLQELISDGQPVWEILASRLAELAGGPASQLTGISGWSGLGMVVGATRPEQAIRLRQHLAHTPFLLPGFGAQGAGPDMARAGLVYQQGCWQGGLVNSARGLTGTHLAQQADDPASFRTAIGQAVAAARNLLDGPAS